MQLPTQPTEKPAASVSAPRAPAEPDRGVRMKCVVDFEPRDVEWLWADRVPLGMLTMFAGDPKLGKSFVTLAMAAALSRGLALPRSKLPNRPGSTILMSAEDDPTRTITPRLAAAGADASKIHIIESVIMADGLEALPCLRVDVDAIGAAAGRLGDCRLIVIDPVTAYLKGGTTTATPCCAVCWLLEEPRGAVGSRRCARQPSDQRRVRERQASRLRLDRLCGSLPRQFSVRARPARPSLPPGARAR